MFDCCQGVVEVTVDEQLTELWFLCRNFAVVIIMCKW